MTNKDIFMFIYGCVMSFVFGALVMYVRTGLTRIKLLELMNEYKEKLNKK
jgi:hypothetical protein